MDEVNLLNINVQQGLGPLQSNIYGDHFFYNLNPETFANIKASDLFDTQFANKLFNENTLYILIGTDSCLLPRYIEKKGIPNGTRYIFIEPLAIFEQLKAANLFKNIDKRIACISLEQWSEAILNFKILDYFYLDAVTIHLSMSAQCDKINAYRELHWHIDEAISQLKWHHNFELGSEIFSIQQLANLADNRYPAILLKDAFKDKTAIILAGGPSLDETLPWLKKHRKNIIVFAVSRIAKRLIQVNIEPDFIVSIDPFQESFDISKDMLTFSSKPVFIYSYHAVPSLVSQWQGVGLYLGGRLPWPSRWHRENIHSAGPTVTNAALNAAYHFGFKRILLAGVDLCFTPEGHTHAQGSNEWEAGPRFNLTSLEIETNSGAMAPTSRDFMAASQSLAAQAKVMQENQCQIINLSANAARTEYVDYIPLETFKLKALGCDVQTIVSECLQQNNEPDFFKQAIKVLKRAHLQFHAIRRVTALGKKCAERLYKDPNGTHSVKDKRTLRQIEHKLNRELEPFSTFVKTFCIRRFLQITRPFNDREKTVEEFHQTGMQFFESYQFGTKYLISLLNQTIEKIKARQEEEKKEPDWILLIQQCVKESAFGRVRRWRKTWPEEKLSEHFKTEFAILEARFTAALNNKQTAHLQETQQASQIKLIKPRADLLFKQKKLDLLEALQLALEKREDQEAILPYRLLIEGYCAELREDYSSAISFYHQLVDMEAIFLDDALLRLSVVSIAIKDHENAYLSLFCLAQRNPLCLPMCARMQELRGDVAGAITSYNAYIARFPEDTVVQLKFAHLLLQAKIRDAADLLLDYILEKNPEHEAAIQMKNQLHAEVLGEH